MNDGQVVSVVLMTLSLPEVDVKAEDRAHRWAELSTEWQMLGTHSNWGEIHGTTSGVARGRMAEILGLAAAAGEQLGLALTCSLDAARWHQSAHGQADTLKHSVSARAFAEMTTYYILGAGHALANATARLLTIDSTCNERLNLAPFDDSRNAWPSYNSQSVTKMEQALSGLALPTAASLVGETRSLVDDDRWKALIKRRNSGYHRWRPQSVAGGTATSNPWTTTSQGDHTLGISSQSHHEPPDAGELVDEAVAGLDALGESMENWLAALPGALNELGIEMFQVEDTSQ